MILMSANDVLYEIYVLYYTYIPMIHTQFFLVQATSIQMDYGICYFSKQTIKNKGLPSLFILFPCTLNTKRTFNSRRDANHPNLTYYNVLLGILFHLYGDLCCRLEVTMCDFDGFLLLYSFIHPNFNLGAMHHPNYFSPSQNHQKKELYILN